MTAEDVIQQECVIWFRNNYGLKHHNPRYVLFSVPNSGKDKKEQLYKKNTGMLAGVADLILLLPNEKCVFIEMKTAKGTQKEAQEAFEKDVKALGFEYYLVRSLEQFKELISNQINK